MHVGEMRNLLPGNPLLNTLNLSDRKLKLSAPSFTPPEQLLLKMMESCISIQIHTLHWYSRMSMETVSLK